jgi:membrane associated rhomboid family serine protease
MIPATSYHLTRWVRRFVAANVVVYLLTATVFTGPWFLREVAFTPAAVADRPWTLFTYAFAHTSLLQLAVNMLMLVMFGPAVERRMGGWSFLRYYLLCGLGGPALVMILSLLPREVTPLVGASASVFGVALAFAIAWPRTRVQVFPLPWPIPVGALIGGLAALALAPAVLEARDGIGRLAQLGGFAIGFVYLRIGTLIERHTREQPAPPPETPALVAHQSTTAAADMAPTDRASGAAPSRGDVALEMDRLLDKISQQGISSLTAAERRFLDEMSRQMRRQ